MSEAVLDTRKVRSWRKYPSYQTIELDWVDRVPDHWTVKRLKWSITSCQNGIWGDEPTGDEDDVGCVRVADFDRLRFVLDESVELTKRSVPKDKQVGRLLNRGDLLLEKSGGGDNQPVGALVLFDSDAIAVCSNFVAKVTVADGYCGSYLRYLHACLYASRVNTRSMKQATGIQNLDSGQYFDEKVAFPSLDEQRAIAAFLDRETALIDALVAKKQRLIDLLEDKRKAIVFRAVTKGLDPTVAMKDSRIAIVGNVPAHWEIKRLKYAVTFQRGHDLPSDERSNGNIPLVTSAGVTDTHCAAIASGPGIVTGRYGTIGKFYLVECDFWPLNTTLYSIDLHGNSVEYLHCMLEIFEPLFHLHAAKSAVPGIDRNDIHQICVAIPTALEEQQGIAESIKVESDRIMKATRQIRRSIEQLHEYRAAIISAAVTGQIDVREEVQLDE